MDAAKQRAQAENDDSGGGITDAEADEGDKTQGAAIAGGAVPAAIVTAAVRGVCKNDALCERFSNVDSSLAGASFEAVQELLDSMDAPSGREGVW